MRYEVSQKTLGEASGRLNTLREALKFSVVQQLRDEIGALEIVSSSF